MRKTIQRVLRTRVLILGLFGGIAAAQTAPFTVSNLNLPFTGTNNTYSTSLTGTGTATVSSIIGAGNVTIAMTGTATRERGLNCGNYVQMSMVFTFDATDSLTVGMTWPLNFVGTPQPVQITGGTGLFKGVGGTGTLTLTQSGGVIAGGGSGVLSLTPPTPMASIYPSGIVPVFSSVPIIQPGSWISIYGTNLANTTAVWNGDFPQNLGNVSVTINNRPAYLWLVSPGQINLQAPDDNVQGCVNVTVTTPNGTVTSQVTLQPQQPAFSMLNARYPAAQVPKTDGSGGFDLVGPVGAFSFATRPVGVGETIVLYGVGFGPVTPAVAAGKIPTSAATTLLQPQVTIGGVQAKVMYSGLAGAGLYQLNVLVPQVPSGDQPIVASLPGANPLLFSSNATQNCTDPDPQGAMPTNCTVYITVK